MKCKTILKQGRRLAWAFCGLLIGASALQSCEDEDVILTGQPDWLGNSIYERLQDEGNYTTMLRLIDDQGQKEVLSRTGSKTLFVADDAAFTEWFKHNDWGVTKYEDLSAAQKKLLLNNAMVNNAYLIELLSNLPVSGSRPLTGMCMRRATATSPDDSITVLQADQMPGTFSWDYVREREGGIHILRDNTAAPMIHFLPAFMRTNKITDSDLEILTNGVSKSIDDSWVNGMKVEESDITCKNGYVQKVGGVIESAPNMATLIRNHENMSMWSHLLDRFSAPYWIGSNPDLGIDSLFELRYFANITPRGKNEYTPGDQNVEPQPVSATLKFDPGWNCYYNYGSSSINGIGSDAAVMIVPTNEALTNWWNNDGYALQQKYKEWDSIPDLTLSKLLNVNMLTSFVESVPSKFGSVLDDAKMELGIKPEHIVSCFMGCNGVVYLTNRVFAPREYSSVSFPALIHQDIMSIIYWAIEDETLSFGPYLNSMDSYYSLFLPTDGAFLNYIDPVAFGEARQILWQFYFDPTASKTQRVKARRYYVIKDEETGEYVMDSYIGEAANDQVRNRLEDMLNQLIVVGNVEDGHQYYKSKGGSMVRVTNAGQENVMTAAGGLQLENGQPLTVSTIYDQSTTGNGKSYLLEGGILEGASKSVYETLKAHNEMKPFLDLLDGNDEDSTKYNLLINTSGTYHCTNYQQNKNIRLFEKYNYTVYVPDSASIQELIDQKYLPTWDDYDAQTEEIWGSEEKAREARALIRTRIFNFLRYHIQDNAIYIGATPPDEQPVRYETSKLNPATQKFFSLMVDVDDNSLTVGYGADEAQQKAQKRHVKTDTGLYNLMCREFWLSGSGTGRKINSASDAVVHLIDGPLYYDDSLKAKTWEEELRELQ
ncbi:MAG: fasciclin domain-containing protein [Prevotella sp.]|nr:fasciclin domain-containing protein [Prevotella sp.]